MKTKIIWIGFLTSLIFLSFVLAQEPKISMGLGGLGIKGEVYLSIYNRGETSITDIKILVDGEDYITKNVGLAPGKGFEFQLSLNPGEHKIEAESAEGAYDSLTINIPKTSEEISETTRPIYENKTFIITVTIILFGILWFMMKPQRLKLD